MSEGAPVVQAAPEPMEQQVETPLQANAEEKAANGANEEATVPEQSAEPSTEADGEPEDVDAVRCECRLVRLLSRSVSFCFD